MAKVLMKGNEAVGKAAIEAGCRYFFGYPITPQSEVKSNVHSVQQELMREFITPSSHRLIWIC